MQAELTRLCSRDRGAEQVGVCSIQEGAPIAGSGQAPTFGSCPSLKLWNCFLNQWCGCIARGNYQLYNGKRSEHKVWAPKKLHGWKLYELVEAKGVVGYIGGRRVKGSFVIKDVTTGKTLVEVTPRKLIRLARPRRGCIITKQEMQREEERASSRV